MTTHRMTTQATHRMPRHRDPKPLSDPDRPVEKAVMTGLILGVLAGLAWIGGMIYTVATWPL